VGGEKHKEWGINKNGNQLTVENRPDRGERSRHREKKERGCRCAENVSVEWELKRIDFAIKVLD
jgi:hypothetical protein